jgi:hypothetical protein
MGDFTSDPLTEALTENRILHRELKATRELLKGTREEIERWKTWGIVEIAVRNPNVASCMGEWEERATKAEAENENLNQLLYAAQLITKELTRIVNEGAHREFLLRARLENVRQAIG